MENKQILQILKHEFAPALGCTEPVAIAYAAAKARKVLGKMPVRAVVNVSRNILKNAMGVGIPGTGYGRIGDGGGAGDYWRRQ